MTVRLPSMKQERNKQLEGDGYVASMTVRLPSMKQPGSTASIPRQPEIT